MSVTAEPIIHSSSIPASHPWTSWAAILAGVTTTIAVQIGLTEVCLAAGLALFEPADPGSSAAGIAVGTVLAVLVCALISVFAGAWVAGRMKFHQSATEAAVHGMLVWAVSGIAALVLTTISLGILAGGAFSLLGQGLSGAAKGIGATLPAAVSAAVPSWDSIKKDISGAMDKRDAASAETLSDGRFADRSRLMQLLSQSFSMDGKTLGDAERDEAVRLFSAQVGVTPEAARSAYDQWQRVWKEGMDRYEAAKEDAKRTAMNAAAITAKRTAQAAMIAFFAMIVGLGAAIAGALLGSECAKRCFNARCNAAQTNRVL